jgi:hypothetical protein
LKLENPGRRRAVGLLFAFTLASGSGVAVAQTSYPPPPPPASAPPAGQYAPPPPGAATPGAVYDEGSQSYDRSYAQSYAEWAAQNCIDQRNNTIAGAAIGGVMGAILGAGVAGHRDQAAGAVMGGALGATAGAAIGANSGAACPPGYVVRQGAPAYVYAPPPPYGRSYAYPPEAIYGPAWYNPWVWTGGVWVYRPYRYWYWNNHAYWGPGYRPGRWRIPLSPLVNAAGHYRRHRFIQRGANRRCVRACFAGGQRSIA